MVPVYAAAVWGACPLAITNWNGRRVGALLCIARLLCCWLFAASC